MRRDAIFSLVVAVAAAGTAAADSDLWTRVTGPTVAPFGGEATFTVHYGNLGPDAALSAYVNLALPAGVPARFDELTDDQRAAIEASTAGTDTRGNLPLLFAGRTCESLLVQVQGPGPERPVPVGPLAAGDEGEFRITVTFPMGAPIRGGLWVDAPEDLLRPITNLGRGYCTDCQDLAGTCFGEPLTSFDLEHTAAVVVDDGDPVDPAMGCSPIVNDVAGKIALIRRGQCEFGSKVWNAEYAGAVGVVIVNNGWCGVLADDPRCVIDLSPGDSAWTTIPAVMVSQLDGEPLIAAAEAGRTVELTLGGRTTRAPAFESTVFLVDQPRETDPEPANDDGRHDVWLYPLDPDRPVPDGAVSVR